MKLLVAHAATVRMHAYAPYSKFAVGAALQTPDGAIFVGANVENAAYPLGLCAESVAIGAMIAAGRRKISAIAIVGDSDDLVTPCGACRQRLAEFADGDIPVGVADTSGLRATFCLHGLLPHAFGPETLGVQPAIEDETP